MARIRWDAALAVAATGLAIIAAATGGTVLWVLAAVCAMLAWGVHAGRRRQAALASAPAGATRVETVPADRANRTISEYAAAGWSMVQQSTAKSFGRSARVTLTFRKGQSTRMM